MSLVLTNLVFLIFAVTCQIKFPFRKKIRIVYNNSR